METTFIMRLLISLLVVMACCAIVKAEMDCSTLEAGTDKCTECCNWNNRLVLKYSLLPKGNQCLCASRLSIESLQERFVNTPIAYIKSMRDILRFTSAGRR